MSRGSLIVALQLVLSLGLTGPVPLAAAADETHRLLVRAPKPHETLMANITALGGTVTYRYKYVDALAVEMPDSALPALRDLVPENAISKDGEIPSPEPVDPRRAFGLRANGPEPTRPHVAARAARDADIHTRATTPSAALGISDTLSNAWQLFARGTFGQGVIVGVIDSGIRPGFPTLEAGHSSVVGCEDFVGDSLGCANPGNNGHGTFVAGMIAAHAVLDFDATDPFAQAVTRYCPSCVTQSGSTVSIPIVGTAPEASIYALRIFGPRGGSPSSRTLAALERVIELKEKFDNREPGGVNIQVVNMSFGGLTLFPGRDLFDLEVNQLLDRNIVFTAAAGNGGPSSITIGSPGSSFAAITVGAVSPALNERIAGDLFAGPGFGQLSWPSDTPLVTFYSSRGPNADGRPDPDVVATGDCIGQGLGDPGSVDLAAGTSFSAPTVAGVAALLRQAFPSATARQIRNAIIQSANGDLIGDRATEFDQGEGYVDAVAAFEALAGGRVADTLDKPRNPARRLAANVQRDGVHVRSGSVSEHIDPLLPGQRHEIFYELQDGTEEVVVSVSNFTGESRQNLLIGDFLQLFVQTARTSETDDYVLVAFIKHADASFAIPHVPSAGFLDPGIMRFTFLGDVTNAGTVSADVHITSTRFPLGGVSLGGRVSSEPLTVPVSIPPGVSVAKFNLDWRHDWSAFPVSDLDMYVTDPNGTIYFDGVTLDVPEEATIANPIPGTWTVSVVPFELHTTSELFEVRVHLDGTLVRLR